MKTTCPRCWASGQDPEAARQPCALCAGAGEVADELLSPHFRLSELLASSTARKQRLRNDPNDLHRRRLRELAGQLLEPVRRKWGPLRVTSGLRLVAVNAAVGSHDGSAHVAGWAADVVPVRRVSFDEVMAWLAASPLSFDQAIHEGTWLHLGLRRPGTGEQRRQLLRMVGGRYLPWKEAA